MEVDKYLLFVTYKYLPNEICGLESFSSVFIVTFLPTTFTCSCISSSNSQSENKMNSRLTLNRCCVMRSLTKLD